MATAIYAGSFDPITNGHVWVIKQALKMFTKVFVAVGLNPEKKSSFELQDRIRMIKNAFPNEERIEVISFQKEFLVNLCSQNSIDIMIRGIRNVQDLEYEQQLLYINEKINNTIQTVYIIPPSEYAGLSSSMVKGLVGFSEWQFVVKDLIPEGNIFFLSDLAFSHKELDAALSVSGISQEARRFIYSKYNSSGRYYHTVQHVNEMLAYFNTTFREDQVSNFDNYTMRWAIIFHDLIYNPSSSTNEEDSVIEWEKFSKKEVSNDEEVIKTVSELIMTTKEHNETTISDNKKLMIDLDLLVLASDVNRFNEYERQIRFEYAQFGDDLYRDGRIKFLKNFLSRNTIYLTETFREKFEQKARLNLNKLLIALENS